MLPDNYSREKTPQFGHRIRAWYEVANGCAFHSLHRAAAPHSISRRLVETHHRQTIRAKVDSNYCGLLKSHFVLCLVTKGSRPLLLREAGPIY